MTYINLRYKDLIPTRNINPYIFNKNKEIVDLGDKSV